MVVVDKILSSGDVYDNHGALTSQCVVIIYLLDLIILFSRRDDPGLARDCWLRGQSSCVQATGST